MDPWHLNNMQVILGEGNLIFFFLQAVGRIFLDWLVGKTIVSV